MIRLGKLRWKNLLSTGNAFTEIDLSSTGTTLIVGGNGGGKSTLTDALSFALYGKPFRKISKTQLVNSINKKDLVVECEFSVNGRNYFVRRGMKPAQFEVTVDGEKLDKDGTVLDQQEHLEKNVLRINHRAFMQVVVLGSASYVPFMELTASHRREVLEDILDMRVLGVMSDLIKPKVSELTQSLKDAEYEHSLAVERHRMRSEFEKAAQVDAEARREVHRQRAEMYRVKMEETAKEALDTMNLIQELEASLKPASLKDEHVALKAEYDVNLVKRYELNEKLDFMQSNPTCPHCDQVVDEAHRDKIVSELRETLATVEAEIERLRVADLEMRKIIADDSALRAKIADLRVSLSYSKNVIRVIKSDMERELRDAEAVTASTMTVDVEPLEVIEGQVQTAQDKRNSLYETRKLYGAVSSLLKDDGAKAMIISQYVPMINDLINGFLRDLDFFVEFELDSEFNEKIRSRYRDEFTYNSFSEGEKMRINLAILFTWRAVARMKNSASTNVIVMDEIFDSSLDPNGAEELMRLLTRLTGDSSVFIISHRTDQMADKFDRVITFEKVGNFSVRS